MLLPMLLLLLFMSNNGGGSRNSISSNQSKISDSCQELMMVAASLPFLLLVSNHRRRGLTRLTLAASVTAVAASAVRSGFAASAEAPDSSVPSSLPAQYEDLTLNDEINVRSESSSGESSLPSAIFNEIESQNSNMPSFGLNKNTNDNNSDTDNNNLEIDGNITNNEATTWSLLLSALFYKLDSFDVNWSNFILAIILVMLMLTTAVGNLFVIVAILIERNLRTIGNYLVLSLAIADLLVACLVMPLAGIYQILERWTLGVLLCDIWTSADVFCCTASILHLLAIALDRYWAVTRVDYIRCQRNERRILFMISLVWFAACIISLAPVFGWKDAQFEWRITNDKECLISQDIGYQIFATCTTFYFPLTLTLIFYWKIYQVARKRIRRKPGNRVKISLQHPSSSSSTSSPSAKLRIQQQQQQQQQQQRSKQPTCQSIAVSQRTGELGNRGNEQVVVLSVEKQIALAGEIDPKQSSSSCPCSCHIQQAQSPQHSKWSPSLPLLPQRQPAISLPISQGNGTNKQVISADISVQNLPSSISVGKQVLELSGTNLNKQFVDDENDGDRTKQQQRDNKIVQRNGEEIAAYVRPTGSNELQNGDHCTAEILPALNNENKKKKKNENENDDDNNLKAGQLNEERQTVGCCSSLDGLSEAAKTTAMSSYTTTTMTEAQEQRSLAGANVDMMPEANIRTLLPTRNSCLMNDDRDNNEPIDINASVCTSTNSNNNCYECPGCKQRLAASKAGSASNNITSEAESLMSQRLNGTTSTTTATINDSTTAPTTTTTTSSHEDVVDDGANQEHINREQPEQASRKDQHCNSHGGSIEEQHRTSDSSGSNSSSLANCDALDNVQRNIISTSLMSQNNSVDLNTNGDNNNNDDDDDENNQKVVRNCSAFEVDQNKHFQCTELLEDCCGCCCDQEEPQQQQQEQPHVQHDIHATKEVDTCKLTSSLSNSVACKLTSIDGRRKKSAENNKNLLATSRVSLDIKGGGEVGRVVSEIVVPPGNDYDEIVSGSKEFQQQQRYHFANLLKLIQESQLALYWHRIKSRVHRRRQGSNLNSTEPDTSTDREIGHAVSIDELGRGTLVNLCKSCNCTTIQNSKNNNNNNTSHNLNDDNNKSTTIINLGDVMVLSGEHRNNNDDDDSDVVVTHLHNPIATGTITTVGALNIAESTANIAVSTVNPPKTTLPTTASILPASPNSVQHHSSQVIATSLTTTKTTLTNTTASTTAEGLESKRERKAAKTLAIITGVFVMCWLPFFVMAITMPLLNLKPHKYVFALMLWLGYVNSMLNPIIYTIFSPDFRKAFKRLLCAMDDSNEMRRRKRMMRGGCGGTGTGGCYTSTSQLQTCGRSTTFVGNSNYNGNSLSSNNSQQTNNNNNNKSCNIILDKSETSRRKIFFLFDYRKCLPEVCQRYLYNLCSLPCCCSSCCPCLAKLMSSSSTSNYSHNEEYFSTNANISTREQSLRRTAIKNNLDRQHISDENNNNNLSRQGHLLNLRNNQKDSNNDSDEINQDLRNQEISNNNDNCYNDNQVIGEPRDRCSPMRRLYLKEQREQDQQQQGTITSNRPAITRNDF